MPPTPVPRTPATWLQVLEPKLIAQQQAVRLFEDYYDGRHRLAYATSKFRESFGTLFSALADNWCEVIVDAAVERLQVQGFRFGQGQPADKDAWEIWQANALDAESVMAHTEAIKNGRAYVLVAPGASDADPPMLTVEHPSQVVVAHAPGNRRQRLAALKKWSDDDGHDYAIVYTPDYVQWFRTRDKRRPGSGNSPGRNWVALDGPGMRGPNPFKPVVPMVPLYNRPTMLGGGRSDLLSAVGMNDAINKLLADMLVASEFAAFPQRIIMGVDVPTDPVTGQPTQAVQLAAAVNRFFLSEDASAKFGEFSAADLNNYGNAIKTVLQHLAAQTRTPPHYLLGEIVNASGDALKAAETGLVARVKRKITDFSDGWEEAMRLAFRIKGNAAQGRATAAETIWADPEYRSEAEMVDAAVKLQTIGVPLEAIWERIGATPQQIADWTRLRGLPSRPAPEPGVTTPSGLVLPTGVPA